MLLLCIDAGLSSALVGTRYNFCAFYPSTLRNVLIDLGAQKLSMFVVDNLFKYYVLADIMVIFNNYILIRGAQ